VHEVPDAKADRAGPKEDPLVEEPEPALPRRTELLQSGPYDFCVPQNVRDAVNEQEPSRAAELLRQLF
jgi:hypothetical protein